MSPPARWVDLRRFTQARVALGRAGNGLPTGAHLAFQAAHAAARDAVHATLDVTALRAGLAAVGIDSVAVRSEAADRHSYLLRPDLGRRLREADRATLAPQPGGIAFVVCDGLSATAVARHAVAVLARVVPALRARREAEWGAQGRASPRDQASVGDQSRWAAGPVVIAEQGRVALGDDIGEALGAEAVAVLIGERPGLSAADSLGIYLTWQPRRGRSDAERNCISNVRPEGLPPAAAADKLLWLIAAMRRLRLTGIGLKDEQAPALADGTSGPGAREA
jgi:ethanolamine ammonia-lyase small subunit